MRMIRCKKCGTLVSTTSAVEERILDEIMEERQLAIKDKKNASVHLANAETMQKYLTQIQHANAQIEMRKTTCEVEKHHLVHYLLDNGLITEEKLLELDKEARAKADEQNKKDQQAIERQYQEYARFRGTNPVNRTKADSTASKAIGRCK